MPSKTARPQWHRLFGTLLDRLGLTEETVLIATAIIVGVGTGFGQVIFHFLIDAVNRLSFEVIPEFLSGLDRFYIVLVPTVGGMLVGLLTYYFAREAKGHGVPEVMMAVAMRGGRIRPIVAVIKAVASAITIGTGGSAGREGPIVQIGSALGSTVGQILNLSDDRIRNLVACGAAAGIAATFNTPIAGVIFALEVILGAFSVQYFSTVVISAVVASVISRSVFGENPVFLLPVEYGVESVWEFAFYPLLGVLAAFVGVAYVRLLYWTEDIFDAWRGVREWLKPAVGGALLGLMALVYPVMTGIDWDGIPHIFGGGYGVMEGAINNELLLTIVFTLMVLKLVATSLTLGSGGSGGVFAPALFMGAMLGTGFELVVSQLFPEVPAPPGAYAIVGMAAVFAASTHAPITGVIILTELTDDHRIILPVMLTVIVATLISRVFLKRESIYTLKLSRRGIRLRRGRDVDIMQGVLVKEAMTANMETIFVEMTLGELSKVFTTSHHHGFPVLGQQGRLWGIVTVTDLEHAIAEHLPPETPLAQIGTPRERLLVAFADESIGDALTRMGARGLGRLPVVSRDDPDKLVGMVRREDLIRAYSLAATRRVSIQSRTNRMQANYPEGTNFVDLTVHINSPVVGHTVQEVAAALPDDCILISVQRNERVIIPHGDTVFEPGDRITAFVHSQSIDQLHTSLIPRPEA